MKTEELDSQCELLAKILTAIPKEDWEERILLKILQRSPIQTWMLYIDNSLYIVGNNVSFVPWDVFAEALRKYMLTHDLVEKSLLIDYLGIKTY
jgi:hypothetical protein